MYEKALRIGISKDLMCEKVLTIDISLSGYLYLCEESQDNDLRSDYNICE